MPNTFTSIYFAERSLLISSELYLVVIE